MKKEKTERMNIKNWMNEWLRLNEWMNEYLKKLNKKQDR